MTRQTEERKASDRSQLSFVGVRWSEKQREEEEDERLRRASKWATAPQQGGKHVSAHVNNQTWDQRTERAPSRGGRSAQRWVNVERCLTRPPPPINPLRNGSVPGTDPSQNPSLIFSHDAEGSAERPQPNFAQGWVVDGWVSWGGGLGGRWQDYREEKESQFEGSFPLRKREAGALGIDPRTLAGWLVSPCLGFESFIERAIKTCRLTR